MIITRKMIESQYNDLRTRNLRTHDLRSIKALHPDVKIRAAATFLINDREVD
jgi:hypothetical protein